MRQEHVMRRAAIRARARRRRATRGRVGRALLLVALAIVMTVGGASANQYTSYTADLPDPSSLNPQDLAQGTKVLDRNGKLLYTQQARGQRRTVVALKAISPLLRKATVDIEDRNFYTHQGIDYERLVSAAYTNFTSHQIQQGGSTITQQLAKYKYLENGGLTIAERSIDRKAREALLAQQIEARYTKDEILGAYLNEIFYGHDSYGIEAASRTYFNKAAADLNLNEASLLAGLPQAPSQYDPLTPAGLALARQRQRDVLLAMVRQGDITSAQASETMAQQLNFTPNASDQVLNAPHFVFYVLDYLRKTFGAKRVDGGGLRVTTTLDLDLQVQAENIERTEVARFAYEKINNGAMAAVDPRTGQVLAYVGSADYYNTAIDGAYDNVAVGGPYDPVNNPRPGRQPGSSFKPYVYLTALANGWSPGSIVADRPGVIGGTKFQDFDNSAQGSITLRSALVGSRNIPPLILLAQLGYDRVFQTARALGITTPLKAELGTAIGSSEVHLLEHTAAYGAFATEGVFHSANPLLKVEDATGHVLYQFKDSPGQRVASRQVTFLLDDILAGYARKWGLNLVGPAAGKSGTTDNGTDLWYVGYTPELVVGSWMARTGVNPDGSPIGLYPLGKNVFGVETSSLVFRDFLAAYYNGRKIPEFQKPPGIVSGSVPCHAAPQIDLVAPAGAILPMVCTGGDLHISGVWTSGGRSFYSGG